MRANFGAVLSILVLLSLLSKANVERDLSQAKLKVSESEQKKRRLVNSIAQLNARIKKYSKEEYSIRQKKMATEESIKILNESIQNLQLEIKDKRSQVRRRLFYMTQFSGKNYLKSLVLSESPSSFERKAHFLTALSKRDIQEVEEYQSLLKDLEGKQFKLLARVESLARLVGEAKSQEAKLVAEISVKQKILESIRAASQFNRKKIAKLRERSRREGLKGDMEFYDLLLNPSFYELKGNLELPVRSAKVEQGFGVFRDASRKISLSHKGIFLSAKESEPVYAVADGNIAFSGMIEGFGNTIIIDHGDHYFSVYSHLSSIIVGEGQALKANQQMARVGRSSAEFGEGIHFEIRHFSEPQDPSVWVRARNQEQGSLQ